MSNSPIGSAANESPCVKICKLSASDVCVGCGRTREEIALWTTYDARERQTVCHQARLRLQKGVS